MLADLFELMHGSKPPDQRKWLRSMQAGVQTYWKFLRARRWSPPPRCRATSGERRSSHSSHGHPPLSARQPEHRFDGETAGVKWQSLAVCVTAVSSYNPVVETNAIFRV